MCCSCFSFSLQRQATVCIAWKGEIPITCLLVHPPNTTQVSLCELLRSLFIPVNASNVTSMTMSLRDGIFTDTVVLEICPRTNNYTSMKYATLQNQNKPYYYNHFYACVTTLLCMSFCGFHRGVNPRGKPLGAFSEPQYQFSGKRKKVACVQRCSIILSLHSSSAQLLTSEISGPWHSKGRGVRFLWNQRELGT